MLARKKESEPPLYVDLDGSLVEDNTLWTCLKGLLQANPTCLPKVVLSLLYGKSRFKEAVSALVRIDPDNLSYRKSLVEFLRLESSRGREIILATGADQAIARAVARHFNLFNDVMASNGLINLIGEVKLQSIQRRSKVFDYVGDSLTDLPLFNAARKYYIAGSSKKVLQALATRKKPEGFFL